MANRILIKRSTTQSSIPTTGDLSLGELALNTYDGRLFAKKDTGTASIIDLTRNDPIRVLGDATSTYAWDQSTYTSNVTVALINSGVTAATYGAKTASTIQNGGNIRIPTFQVHANGIIYSASTVTIDASDFGTMAVQDSNNVSITGGSISGVQVSISGGDGTFGNVTVNGKLFSNDITAANITVDGDTVITGNLQVQGTQTIVDSTTIAVGDLNILLAKDAANATQATGAGITVNGPATQATFTYNGTSDSWNLNKDTNITGAITVSNLASLNGGIAVDTNKFTVEDGSGNTAIAGTLTVTDLASFNGGITADSGKFTVADGTGNIHTDGTLDVDGNSTLNGTLQVDQLANLNGGIAVDTDKFTVADGSGNTVIAGTLDVDGAVDFDSTLNVAGLSTLDGGISVPGTSNEGTQYYPSFSVSGTTSEVTVQDANIAFYNGTGGGGVYSSTLMMTINGTTGDINTSGKVDIGGNLTVSGVLFANGGVSFDAGAFTVANDTGDIHTSGNLDVDQNTTLNGTLTVDGLTTLNGGITVDAGAFTIADATGDIHTSGNLDVDQNTTLNGTLTVDGITNLNGGIAVDTNKFTVADGTGNTYVDGTLNVKGAVTTDAVTANGIVFGDNVTGALTTDSGFTYNATTNTFTAENINSTGNITVGNLVINGTTSMSSVTSASVGATQIVYGGAGGAFKGEAAFTYAEDTDTLSVGNITVADDVAVNGGDLTTSAATFNLVNANATTVNFAGAATTVEIGASSGTTTINNNGQVDGTLGITGNVTVNTDKFVVVASSGNVSVAGTLGITGATTLQNTLDVTGAATFANIVSLITANAQMTLSNYSTGSLRVLGDVSVDGKIQASGAIYKAGFEVLNTQDTIDGGTY